MNWASSTTQYKNTLIEIRNRAFEISKHRHGQLVTTQHNATQRCVQTKLNWEADKSGRDVYLKSICIWKYFSNTFFYVFVFVFVFEEFFEKVFLFVVVFAYWKNSDFKYKYILFQKIKFIWSLFLTS
jgi:hypothetical protein